MGTPARIGIVGGNGRLGGALASAAVASGAVEAGALTLSSRSGTRGGADIPGAHPLRPEVGP